MAGIDEIMLRFHFKVSHFLRLTTFSSKSLSHGTDIEVGFSVIFINEACLFCEKFLFIRGKVKRSDSFFGR